MARQHRRASLRVVYLFKSQDFGAQELTNMRRRPRGSIRSSLSRGELDTAKPRRRDWLRLRSSFEQNVCRKFAVFFFELLTLQNGILQLHDRIENCGDLRGRHFDIFVKDLQGASLSVLLPLGQFTRSQTPFKQNYVSFEMTDSRR